MAQYVGGRRLWLRAGHIEALCWAVAIGLLVWTARYPHPFVVCMTACLLVPWAAVFVTWLTDGELPVLGEERDRSKGMALLICLPVYAVLRWAVFGAGLVDWPIALIPAAVVGALWTVAVIWVQGDVLDKPVKLVVLFAIGTAHGLGAVGFVDGLGDWQRTVERVTVTAKVTEKSKASVDYVLVLSPWSLKPDGSKASIRERDYLTISEGATVCVTIRHGLLGLRRYGVGPCE